MAYERKTSRKSGPRTPLGDQPPPVPTYPGGPYDPRYVDKTVIGRGHPVDPDLEFDPDDIQHLQSGPYASVPLTGSDVTPAWQVLAGANLTFTAALVDPAQTWPAGVVLGARVENPGTRAIVSHWQAASLSGSMYTVTLDSPLIPGPYQLVWMTNDSPVTFQSFIPLIAIDPAGVEGDPNAWPAVPPDAVRPTVDEIAQLEGTRSRDQNTGEFKGTFDDSTFPTAAQVEALIDDAINDVLAIIPDVIDPGYWPRAKTCVKYLTAILIEQSFFRNAQGGASSGVVLTYQARLNADLVALSESLTGTALRLR